MMRDRLLATLIRGVQYAIWCSGQILGLCILTPWEKQSGHVVVHPEATRCHCPGILMALD